MVFSKIACLFLLAFGTFVKGQNLQITMLMKMKMKVPVVGPINITFDQTVAPGFYKAEEKTEAERFLFRWIGGDITGEIMIAGTDKIIKYDVGDEEYWLETPEEYFAENEPDTSNGKKKSYSFSFSSEDDDAPPKITRFAGQGIETIHGYRTKKWITTVTSAEKKMIIEEWFVDKLPLQDLHDSLKAEMLFLFNPDTTASAKERFEFTSNILLEQMDTLHTLEPLSGRSVKTNFLLYDEDEDPEFTMGFEILELYAESVDTAFFTIPERFKKTVK